MRSEGLGLFKIQLDQNPQHKLVMLSKGGSDMKKAAGSVTAIVNTSNPHPNTCTDTHVHMASGHKNADW